MTAVCENASTPKVNKVVSMARVTASKVVSARALLLVKNKA